MTADTVPMHSHSSSALLLSSAANPLSHIHDAASAATWYASIVVCAFAFVVFVFLLSDFASFVAYTWRKRRRARRKGPTKFGHSAQ